MDVAKSTESLVPCLCQLQLGFSAFLKCDPKHFKEILKHLHNFYKVIGISVASEIKPTQSMFSALKQGFNVTQPFDGNKAKCLELSTTFSYL